MSGPLVRSSYRAGRLYAQAIEQRAGRYLTKCLLRYGSTRTRERTSVTLRPPAPNHTAWMPLSCGWHASENNP